MNTVLIKIEELDPKPMATWAWSFTIQVKGKAEEFGGYASTPLDAVNDALKALGKYTEHFTQLHMTVTTK